MKYLQVKYDLKLYDEAKTKFKQVYEGQLFTIKEMDALKRTYYNFSTNDVYIVEISKRNVIDYFKDGERRAIWDVQLPF